MQHNALWSILTVYDASNLYLFLWIYVYMSCFVMIFILIPAAFDISLGIKKTYLRFLLLMFDWGKQKIKKRKIERNKSYETSLNLLGKSRKPLEHVFEEHKFEMQDAFHFIKWGMESIIEDEVTQRFNAEELPSWNFLTRTNMNYQYLSVKLSILWMVGFFLRYFVLFPLRVVILVIALSTLFFTSSILGFLPDCKLRRWLTKHLSLMVYRMLCGVFSASVTFHNRDLRPKKGIVVANHTSPIDVLILSCDSCYAMIGQSHTGFTGAIQSMMSRTVSHVWFQRTEANDRQLVLKRLRDHVEHPDKLPIIIFPEGTCINNTSVMMFKKGSFEITDVIHPIAIKYDSRFGDAFWNSMRYSMVRYLIHMMTSWAIVCEVWYMPPSRRLPNEDAFAFASRVKNDIARQGGLVDLVWDGNLKRYSPSVKIIDKQKQHFSKSLKRE